MDEKLKILLEKEEIKEEYISFFAASKLEKIVVSPKNKSWTIYIHNESMYPKEVIAELDKNKYKLDPDANSIRFVYHFDHVENEQLQSYYPLILENLKNELKVLEIYQNKLVLEEDQFVLIANNKVEEEKLQSVKDYINQCYHDFSYEKEIPVVLRNEENLLEEIQKELDVSLSDVKMKASAKKSSKQKERKDAESILGRSFSDSPLKIKTLLGEDNNVTVESYIFEVDYFESAKTDFKIITLKVTDYTDSIYCKVFVRDEEEYQRLKKELKVGMWVRIRGYTKNDTFAKELVLNARDIIKVEKENNQREDCGKEKRVELHTHTMMSQMDGLADEVKLVKQAIAWGQKAIAITDHNGVQAFPHVFNFVTGYNKGKEEQDKFKVIYGTELTMIDDEVHIVTRANDQNLLDQTYVVFDFETTGFNAGGADTIIEIGAVKIKNGEILERYDELINPGKPLPKKITEITNITDSMLQGKDNEENAVKRFIDFFGDLPMVAHNAKFDVSFLEMAYQKYGLGEFKNPVIDTLELSRTLDNNYARHSLSALVKRYEVPWDEEAHHRGDYDAEGTALVFHKMLKKLSNRNIDNMNQLENLVSKEDIHKYGRSHHINILAKNKEGLKNLFKLISLANTTYLYKTPRILRSAVQQYRKGLFIGSGCYESEVFNEAKSKSEEELSDIIRFYDYVEVQPLDCYTHLIQTGDFGNELELSEHLKKIIRVTEEAGKYIVATGDVHYIDPEDKIYREIIINQKVPGGGRHPLARNNITEIPNNHFRTTDEMQEDFAFLEDEALVDRLVVQNPNAIAKEVEEIEVIIDTGGIPFSPRIDHSIETVTNMVFHEAENRYGHPLPYNIEERISKELYGDGIYEAILKEVEREKISEEEKEKEIFSRLHQVLIQGFEVVKEKIKQELKIESPSASEEELGSMMTKKLGGVIGGGFDVIYLIAQKLVKHSNDEGYLVGSRGSVGSSFVATMMGITEVNPLPAHYLCRNKECKYSEFLDENQEPYGKEYSSGYDLPDKKCPKCGEKLGKEGQDMPFATFLGFNADKVPDIDLNFSGDNQASAHAYTKVLFGEENVYRAGTIGTVAEKTAFGFVKGYLEEKEITDVRSAEVERLALGCTGVKRTTGQHPGGIVVIPAYMDVFDFTPFQYPADDATAEWKTTHFDYHAIDQDVLKLDILGHDDPTVLRMLQDLSGIDVTTLPMDDKKVFSLLTSPEALGVHKEDILCSTGTLGLPELGTRFVINMLEETKPKGFGELVKISGLSHGTDVWAGNASELIRNQVVPFKDVIGCRDDIMVNLMNWGMKPIRAFKIMEFVRKGKASKDPDTWKEMAEEMRQANVPEWYIESCRKIKYMFPKAHACAYVMSAIRIAWFKLYHPLYYYAAYFSVRVDDFDIETMIQGYDAIKEKLEDLQAKGFEATNKETNIIETLKIALEATARGIHFSNISLEKSQAKNFVIDDSKENTLIPSFSTIDGLGISVGETIVSEREKQPFLSVEDVQKRGKVSKTLIDKMTEMKILEDLPDSNQLSLF